MSAVMEAEIIPPGGDQQDRPRVRLAHVGTLGIFGTFAALLTMFAAVGVGFLVLFGTTVACALLTWAVWPHVFSAEFTQWVFGAPTASFWKLFVLFLAAGAVTRLLNPLRKR
jgi:hypothetical protein